MEMSNSPSAEEDTDEGFVGYPSLPQGIRPQPRPHQYMGPNRSGERLSCRDHYEMPRQANHEDVPYEGRYAAPPCVHDAWVAQRPGPIVHLAKMQDFQAEGNDRLDSFFNHVEELADFYRWDGRETCHQARAHLRGTLLSYVKRAPFQPRTWEELKALLLKHFQPRDFTATYKAQFCARRRRHSEDTHTFVEALQCLADMAWLFMDGQAKEELVVDQFLLGMDNHELSVQVAAHGHRHTEHVLRLARSLEAVHEEERHASLPRKPAAMQARLMNNRPPYTTDTERVVQEVLAQLGHDSRKQWGG